MFIEYSNYKARKGFGKFWEADNAISQDLENFGKEKFFKMAMGKLDFCLGKFYSILKWI